MWSSRAGKLSVEPYDYHDRDARITCSADTLMKIATGKLDPVAAFTCAKSRWTVKLKKPFF